MLTSRTNAKQELDREPIDYPHARASTALMQKIEEMTVGISFDFRETLRVISRYRMSETDHLVPNWASKILRT